jgi:hypothetical protein
MNALRLTTAVALGLISGAGGARAAEMERAGRAEPAPNATHAESACAPAFAVAETKDTSLGDGVRAPAEREQNAWPVVVRQLNLAGQTERQQAAGPLIFRQTDREGGTVRGFRPFWVEARDARGDLRGGYFLYPLFSYTQDESTYKWTLFELVRNWGRRPGAPAPNSILEENEEFEIFPFWFSRRTGDPDMSYRALFPIGGTVKSKLGFERLSWVLFPLYVENEKHGAVTRSTPWPIIRRTTGAAHGFGVWPLFNYVERPGVSRAEYYLWPLGFNVTRLPAPDAPPGTAPRRDVGLLPFYARSTGPGYINEDFLWPFFGYTDRAAPVPMKKKEGIAAFFDRAPPGRYHETRYLWPFLVQGRGEQQFINRWGPFYTHSIVKGYDKTWYLWPAVRRATWQDEGVRRDRTQFLYFLYWNETQRAAGRAQAPEARLTHLWPLFSRWDNGAGQSQFQLFSPLEVFFPGNDKVRAAWSPLFAIARHEQRAPGDTRTSLLWDAITWERRPAEARREVHVGPLFSVVARAEEKRVAIGNGLFGWKRDTAAGGWRFFWWDFRSRSANSASPASR